MRVDGKWLTGNDYWDETSDLTDEQKQGLTPAQVRAACLLALGW